MKTTIDRKSRPQPGKANVTRVATDTRKREAGWRDLNSREKVYSSKEITLILPEAEWERLALYARAYDLSLDAAVGQVLERGVDLVDFMNKDA